MAIEAKEVVMYTRKFILFSIKTSYRAARYHPLSSALVLLVFILYRIFPSLFTFLISYSPVIICTALLLGTLLSYGAPNIPHIEETTKKTREISSMRVKSNSRDIVTKKEESSVNVVNRTVEEEDLDQACSSATNEVLKELNELRVNISKPTTDDLIESALGSPWEPINIDDVSSGSDSESSGSSSPDASMADIIPLLDELHPLLNSEHPQDTTKSASELDSSSSSDTSEDEESEETEKNDEKGKEVVQEGTRNDEAVSWNSDDQRNVMDLGVSELERNRRLESLIAKRRERKLIRYETEKNLIDLNSYYPTPMPLIHAPRRNPFDTSYDSVPGSAPSILHPRENPFDLPYDQVERITSFSKEYLSHHDFVPSQEKDVYDSPQEKDEYNLVSHQRIDSGEIDFASIQRHLGVESTSNSSFQPDNAQEDIGEQSHQDAEELREKEANMPDSGENEGVEQKYEESSSSSSEDDEKKSSEMGIHEESTNMEGMRNESLESDTDSTVPVASVVYDSSPSSLAHTISNVSFLDEAFNFEGKEDVASSSLPSDMKEDLLSVAVSPPKPMTDESAYSTGGVSKSSSSASSLDGNESSIMETSEIKERDDIQVEISKDADDVPEPVGEDKSTQSQEESHTSILDLPTIHEEYVDHVKFGEHGIMSEPGVNSDITELRAIGEEQTETVHSNDILSHMNRYITDEVHREHAYSEISSNFHENYESEIDEGLLAELDAVSDFQIERETGSNQSEVSHTENDDAINSLDIPDEVKPARDCTALETEIESSAAAAHEDPEMTVYNPKLHVFEACSSEELDSVFKQQEEKSVEPSSSLDLNKDPDSELQVLEVRSREELDSVFKQQEEKSVEPSSSMDLDKDPDSELQVLEVCSREELDSVFKQQEEQSVEPFLSINDDKVPDSELQVLELRSREELDSVFKQQEEKSVEPSSSMDLDKDPDSELHVLEVRSHEELDSIFKQQEEKSIEPSSSIDLDKVPDSELPVLEVRSHEELDSIFKQQEEKSNEPSSSTDLDKVPDSELPVLEVRSHEELDSIFKQQEEKSVEPSSSMDLDKVPNSELHVLEVRSHEELDSIFKQQEEKSVEPSSSINLVKDPDSELPVLEVRSHEELDSILKQQEEKSDEPSSSINLVKDPDSDLPVLEVRSHEELDSIFKQQEEKSVEPSSSINLDTPDSELPMLEVRSHEELDSVFKQQHEKSVEPSSNINFDEDHDSELHVLEAGSLEELDSVFKQQEEKSVEPSSSINVDKVPDSELHVLEVRSHEELDSVFKQQHEKSVESSSSINSGKDQDIEELAPQLQVPEEKSIANEDVAVVEAKSPEDIDLPFKQLSEDEANQKQHESEVSEAQSSEALQHESSAESSPSVNLGRNLDAEVIIPQLQVPEEKSTEDIKVSEGTNADVVVLEAKSLEDINLAFKQLESEVSEAQSTQGQQCEKSIEPSSSVDEVQEKSTDEDVAVVEARSLEDIDLAFKQHSEGIVENPSPPESSQDSNASVSRKSKKKKKKSKSVKSGSSSSSDSSSSSSDSE